MSLLKDAFVVPQEMMRFRRLRQGSITSPELQVGGQLHHIVTAVSGTCMARRGSIHLYRRKRAYMLRILMNLDS